MPDLTPELKTAIISRVKKIPIVDTLNLTVETLARGYCLTRVPRKRRYDGVFESFHGGLLMTVADSTACFAIFTKTGPDIKLTTTDMHIRFLAPCLTGVVAEATVIKLGRTLCPVAVDVFDEKGQKVAVAQVTYILLGHNK